MDKGKSKISNTEWGLVIGALFVIDLVQIGLDLLAQIGVFINRFIDVFVGLSFAFYLQMRGQSLADPKRLAGLIGTLVGEEIPDVDAFPFWTLDGIFNMSLSKSEKILSKMPVAGGTVTKAMSLMEGKNIIDRRSIKEKIDTSTKQIQKMTGVVRNRKTPRDSADITA